MTEARRITVEGRVQGVGFRAWTRDTASGLALAGWVRNLEDGSVEAHVEGPAAQLTRMIDRLREGPLAARVDHLRQEDVPATGAVDFEIRR